MDIKASFKIGVFWTSLGKYANLLLQFFVTMVLARILNPADFGILAMVVVYTGFVNLLSDAGIGSAVIQRKEICREELSTVFWLSVFVGILMISVTIVLAQYIEKFFSFNGLSIVLKVMSINFLLLAMGSVPFGLLQRELKFKQIAVIEIISSVVAGSVAILLALKGFKYWALVHQIICSMGIKLILSLIFSRWYPKLNFNIFVAKSVVSFSSYVLGFSCVNYWSRNADNLLIGKILGPIQLGFYSQAYKLLMMPLQIITGVINPSIHPIFSSIQHEKIRMGRAYLKIIQFIALISFPLGGFLFVFAQPVIQVVWGNNWANSIPVLKILSILAAIQPVVSTSGGIFLASNMPRFLFCLGFWNSAIMVVAIYIGVSYGVAGVALSYMISYLILVLPVTMFYVAKTLCFDLKEYIRVAYVPMLGFVMIFIIGEFGKKFLEGYNQIEILIFGIMLLLIVYAGLITRCFKLLKETRPIVQ